MEFMSALEELYLGKQTELSIVNPKKEIEYSEMIT